MTVFPAIVREPERLAVDVLAATENETVPLPVPEAPAVILSQEVSVEAVQAHPAGALTVTESVLAAATGLKAAGVTVKLHVIPAWLIVNFAPAIAIVPERAVVEVLAATL